jgi:hypothetical protein
MSAQGDIDATATASAIHRFNRYEIKYLMAEQRIFELRDRLARRMTVDANTGGEPERISSLYYDTRDLRFYWEKIEGIKFRRKLRIRVYGEPDSIDDDSQAFVEIKQRTNRVTQKRRVALPYRHARTLCAGQPVPAELELRPAFANEVLTMVTALDLQPAAVTTYLREPFIGVDADIGMRITLDHRVCGRRRDFDLAIAGTNQFLIPQQMAIVEVKANERVPTWFTDLAAELELTTVRISKYCKAIEAHSESENGGLRNRPHPPADSTRQEHMS